MLLSWFAERAGNAGAHLAFKIDGPRERKKWTLILSSPPYEDEYWARRSDFEDLGDGLDWVRETLRLRPGDWSWVDEPLEDADAFAAVMEEIGAMDQCFIVQYAVDTRWTLIGAGVKVPGYPNLEACLFDGFDRVLALTASAPAPPPPGTAH